MSQRDEPTGRAGIARRAPMPSTQAEPMSVYPRPCSFDGRDHDRFGLKPPFWRRNAPPGVLGPNPSWQAFEPCDVTESGEKGLSNDLLHPRKGGLERANANAATSVYKVACPWGQNDVLGRALARDPQVAQDASDGGSPRTDQVQGRPGVQFEGKGVTGRIHFRLRRFARRVDAAHHLFQDVMATSLPGANPMS